MMGVTVEENQQVAEKAQDITDMIPEFSARERRFVLHAVTNPDASNAEHARAAGCPANSSRQRGYELSNRPEVQMAIEALRERIGDSAKIDVNRLVDDILITEALTADNSRDRREAAHLLGKTLGKFRDVVDQTNRAPDDDLIDKIRQEFGDDAADKARAELGIE